MATVGDYVAFGDSRVTLKIGGDLDHTYNFSIPNNVNRNQPAVLTWQFEADGNPNNLAWKWNLNGTDVASYTHGIDRFCALQEIVAGSRLSVGNNSLTATVTGGSGQIKLSDIAVHFQVNV
jgi:hypothetical protein